MAEMDHRKWATSLIEREFGSEPSLEDAVASIAHSLVVLTQPDDAVRRMREHAAETDHALTMRLIDVDVFAVHCIPNCSFHTEWRTT